MKRVINIYKPVGLTPLQLINKFKAKYPQFLDKKITYIGRLDPMAQGVMILLVGESVKDREKYLKLNKKYLITILFGVETDTYDTLGLINFKDIVIPNDLVNRLKKHFKQYIGKIRQKYPPYSSRTVFGKPLFWWARNNILNEITIPEKIINIYEIKYKSINYIDLITIGENIKQKVNTITGDFRQEKILKSWNKYARNNRSIKLPLVKLEIFCSSGTYVRSIAHQIGHNLGIGAIAYDIQRTEVGKFKLSDSIYL